MCAVKNNRTDREGVVGAGRQDAILKESGEDTLSRWPLVEQRCKETMETSRESVTGSRGTWAQNQKQESARSGHAGQGTLGARPGLSWVVGSWRVCGSLQLALQVAC